MSVKKMPKRTTIRIPDTLVTDIERWAKARGQGFATVCALAVEMGVKQAKETGELPLLEAETLSKQEKKDS